VSNSRKEMKDRRWI